MSIVSAQREFHIHVAKVHLAECARRRGGGVNRDFYWRLFAWAQNSRRRAAVERAEPVQGGLFQ